MGDRIAKERAQALIGTVLSGRYKIVDLLAMGGVGAVYLGEHVKMHKHVAIKVLHPDAQSLPDITARFEREAVAGAHIQHPNVAAATDFGEVPDGTHFLVLEYVKGTTLREVVRRGPLPVGRAVGIAKQIAAALAATHAANIVHRDVKPRNVMLIEGERDVVKLIDFGLAKLSLKEVSDLAKTRASMSEHQITGTGAVFGTIAYLAPEAALGMDSVDARADLYALGLVLYEMLAGKHPFDTSDPVALFKHHARTPPPPIAERVPGVTVPPAVEAVVQRLLAKQRDGRYPSAEALIAALDAAWEGGAATPSPAPAAASDKVFPGPSITQTPPPSVTMPSVTTPPGVRDVEAPRAARARWPLAVGALGIAVVAAAAAWWAAREPAEGQATAATSSATAAVSAATATVTATATATATAAAPRVDMDPGVARAALRKAAYARDRARGLEAFTALVQREPAAFHEPAVAIATRDLATAVALAGGEDADKMFAAMGHELGADGLDILYEIVRLRGGSKAAVLAEEQLRTAGAMDRASPALRVTWTLRDAPCSEKAALLDKAAADGDLRTLTVMQTTVTACLGPQNEALRAAIRTLRPKAR